MPDQSSKSQGEPLVSILQSQVILCWERFGTERLAVTKKMLEQFTREPLPELMRTSVKRRMGKKIIARSRRVFNNTSSFIESWPEDDQAIFRYPALVFVCEGQADFCVADYIIHCSHWHFLLFATDVPRPVGGRPHLEGDNAKKGSCKILWFFAPPGTNSVTAYVCHCEGEKHWHSEYRVFHRPEVISLFQLLLSELEEVAPGHAKIVHLSGQTFFHLLLNELLEGHFHKVGDISTSGLQSNTMSQIEQAQHYIKTHLKQPLTTALVAQQVHMSRSSFVQNFSRETGVSFHEFVNKYRMEEAKRLLSGGYWSITSICNFVGLRPTQFRAQFKKYFGVAPSQFRQDAKNKQNR